MKNEDRYRELALLAKDLTLLYVEDNLGLQRQAGKIFKKFFRDVIVAQDGQEGLDFFKKHNPKIVITDIKMPKINGLDMSREMKELDSEVKIIITSAFDEKEYLYKSIDAGVTKYLKKPIPIDELIEILINVINQINDEKNKKIFDSWVKDTFEYQDNMLILIENNEVLVVNQKCLEFFTQKNSKEFQKFFKNFSKLLLPQKNFLYEQNGISWLEIAKENSGKLFNVKMKDNDEKNRHFILKANKIPQKNNYFILSFDDITELGLMQEDDPNLSTLERKKEDNIRMINLLHVIKRNGSEIRLFNSYKGLSISNTATIEEVMADHIKIKTTYLQQRAIHIDKKTTIESELFPKALVCKLESINFETQTVILKDFSFTTYLPSEQKYVRVMPQDSSKVEVFFNAQKVLTDIHIKDISIEGCNLSFSALPAGLKTQSNVLLKLKLGIEQSPLNLQLKSEVLKIIENKNEFNIVVTFQMEAGSKKLLIDYIAKRQMALIREFKGLQNAK